MCGICGILNTALEPARHRESIERMSGQLVHRGPDSQGKFELPYVALAIRRLSIIDLETGDQPLSNETGSITLVFNGEIYNYQELRKELLDRGHCFRTRSDGEVIAHLYEDLGLDFTRELNGMFAIALWDEERKRLVLARDRAGEKPLYYWRKNHTLVFGSEIKSLLEYPGVGRAPDVEATQEYLLFGYVPAPRSIFREIRKLPAGCRMVAEGGEIRVQSYWKIEDYLRPPGRSQSLRAEEEDAVRELRTRLGDATVSRLVSDVPLGVFLSGGVDSSVLVALMSELAPGHVNTFSVAFTEKSFNEEPYSRFVARYFNTQHHVLRVDEPALQKGLAEITSRLDEPLADPAVIPTFLLSRFAREHVKVALSGEGSDELFGGYPTYLGAQLAQYYLRLPGVLRRQLFGRLKAFLPISSKAVPMGLFLRRFLSHAEKEPAERHLTWFGMFTPAEIDEISGPGLRDGPASSAQALIPLHEVTRDITFENALAEALFLDFRLYLADDLLVKIDRASMACSLELRTPFLDHRLIEFAAALPVSFKVRRFELKHLLKKAVEPRLPAKIVYRQKRGFSVPIAGWLRNELRPLVNEMLSEGRLKQEGFFNPLFVRRLVEEHQQGKADHRKTLWTLLCFELWYEHWAQG
ncbi:MAG: asparagine synthase (glutamine-hydrolyzing) [Terriglobia bacterium]